ncbi:uncharacterized protein SCHCODRAFT_02532947 [Schizophyllum commune H4-8]|nr:uncharacterized protein SCHCODRAFT_02532947 [Schizophyllum commune H4-8]KAI5896680.1 hypothetical protein SCHCODRAFT_02532947 [Schizophyllum commune H4-8]
MGRHYSEKQKNARKEKHIEYVVSEGQRGRNPGISKALKRVRDIGYKSILPGEQRLIPASSSNWLSPVYPAPYLNFTWQVAGIDKLLRKLQWYIKSNLGPYGLAVQEYLQAGSSSFPSRIYAAGLVSLVLCDPALDEEARAQVHAFFKVLHPPRLTRAHISLAGKSKREHDPAMYQMLGRAKDSLTHLSLELSFADKLALQAYLSSAAASRLVSLELKTNSDIQEQVLNALQDEDSARLPNLEHLCLKIKKVDVAALMVALERRRARGCNTPLRVEIRNDIDDAVRAKARDMGITFDKPCPMRCGL